MDGVIFLENHPEIAGRSCERCRKWAHDKDGNIIEREPGVPEPRSIPPNCAACPKNAPDVAVLTPQNYVVYKSYVACRELGCLPRSGGLGDQVPEIARKFEYLAMIDRQRELVKMSMPGY